MYYHASKRSYSSAYLSILIICLSFSSAMTASPYPLKDVQALYIQSLAKLITALFNDNILPYDSDDTESACSSAAPMYQMPFIMPFNMGLTASNLAVHDNRQDNFIYRIHNFNGSLSRYRNHSLPSYNTVQNLCNNPNKTPAQKASKKKSALKNSTQNNVQKSKKAKIKSALTHKKAPCRGPKEKPSKPGCKIPPTKIKKTNPGCGGATPQVPTQCALPALEPEPVKKDGCGGKQEPTEKGGCILAVADEHNGIVQDPTKEATSDDTNTPSADNPKNTESLIESDIFEAIPDAAEADVLTITPSPANSASSVGATRIKKRSPAIRPGDVFVVGNLTPEAIEEGIQLTIKDLNKMDHIFDNKEHLLGPLIVTYGSQEAVLRVVLTAAHDILPSSGVFEDFPIPVDDVIVYLKGNIINGVPRPGTMFIKKV